LTDLTALAAAAREELIARHGELGPEFAEVDVTPVLNWGGFVNRSFHVAAGARRLHLKLASDPGPKHGLEQWRSLHSILETRYRAPAMLTWVDVPRTAFSGPLFEWIAGTVPVRLEGAALEEMTALLVGLHADRILRQRLVEHGHTIGTCAAAYLDGHHRRFREDLDSIVTAPPPFAGLDRIDWMWEQVRSLEEEISASPAFEEPADAPAHRDLWLDNLLVSEGGTVTVLDWDDLGLGDPVMDWAMLLGPSRQDPRPATERAVILPPFTPSQRERLRLWARATLLDWVIDPLSDWVGAASEPEQGASIRAANEVVHANALGLYLELYG
jgi:hypothetical protein